MSWWGGSAYIFLNGSLGVVFVRGVNFLFPRTY